MEEKTISELAEEVMNSVWGILPSERECSPWCGERGLHVDDFVALTMDRGLEADDERAEAWAKSAIEADGGGIAEIRLIRPVRGTLVPWAGSQEIADCAIALRQKSTFPLGVETKLYRVWYFRGKH